MWKCNVPSAQRAHLNPRRSFGMSVWRHVYLQPLTRVHHVELLHRRSNDVNERVISSVPLYYPLIFRCYVMHVFVKATDRENFLIPSSRQMYFREITAICYDETCFDSPIMDHLMEDKNRYSYFNADHWFNIKRLILIFI